MEPLNSFALASGLLGGLAFFLYGLDKLTESLNSMAGDKFKNLLAAATGSPVKGVLTGAGITAVVQSSSVTTVLCVGFISAGLMSLEQAVGVILGANVGSTVTAQLIAFDLDAIALPLVSLGMFVRLGSRSHWRHLGTLVFGLGLVFYGMSLMSQATLPLRELEPFIQMMQSFEQAWLGILVGALFTALVQSSSATTGIVIVLSSGGMISLKASLALILGANLGTCVTALVAAVGRGRGAMQAATVHVLFNSGGVLLWWLFLDPLASLTVAISGPDAARQVANAHTVFNVGNALVCLGLTAPLAQLARKLVPDKPHQASVYEPVFLDVAFLSAPSLALERVRLELQRFAELCIERLREVKDTDEVGVHELHRQIVNYLRLLSQKELAERETRTVESYLIVVNALETVAECIDDLARLEAILRAGDAAFLEDIENLHQRVVELLEEATLSIHEPERLETVTSAKEEVRNLRHQAMHLARERLNTGRPGAAARYRHRGAQIDELGRIYYLSVRIARARRSTVEAESTAGPGS